ncbi:MAG: hypothetical protein MUD10_03005, partial [Candidatus Pacebacteria bacterium]|nr:hypothetical protein [Candidatus Paceibacterota bacterium]
MRKINFIASFILSLGILIVATGPALACCSGYGEKGWIKIDKITDPAGDPQEFNFTVSGANGNAAFGLKDADAPVTKELKTGFYSVAEAAVDGWQQVSVVCASDCGGTVDPKAIDLGADEIVTCTFKNKKVQKGSITIKKVTVGGDDTFAFTGDVTSSLANGGTATAQVMPGTYTSTEAVKTGWDLTGVVCDDSDSTGNTGTRAATFKVAAGENVTCTFTNTKQGRIVVDKATDPAQDPQSFGFVVTGAGYNNFSLTDAAPANDQELAPGAYTISETPVSGWQFVSAMCARPGIPSAFIYTPGSTLNLGAGETWNCVFTNKKQSGTLIVKKVLDIKYGADVDEDEFSFTVNEGQSTAFEEDGQNEMTVAAGTYDIDEVPATGFETSYAYGDTNSCENVVVPAGGSATCTITNRDVQSKLTVEKIVVNGPAQVSDFILKVNDSVVVSGQQNSFNAGNYTVGETIADSFFNTIYDKRTIGGDCGANGTITLKPGDVKKCTVTNEDGNAAKLVVIKHVVNDNGGTAQAADFTMSVTGVNVFNPSFAGSEAGTTVYLDAGNYNVTEAGPAGYAVTYGADCTNGTLAIGQTKTCTVTNDDKPNPAALTLVKKVDCGFRVTCGQPNCANPADFKLTATDNGQNIDLQGMGTATGQVEPGTYVLGESGPEGYTASDWVCVGATQEGDLVTLAAGQSATCTITNTKDQAPPPTRFGKLKVVKYAIGVDGKTEFAFAGDNGLGTFNLTPLNGKWMKMAKASRQFENLAA